MGGALGIDPRPFTLRELSAMFHGRKVYDWSHTSSLMALLAELKRDRKKRIEAFTPAEFDPTQPDIERNETGPSISLATLAEMIGAEYTPHDTVEANGV